jgi:sugar phosphate permease
MGSMWQGAKQTYGTLLGNRLWLGTVAGYTAYTFALGGFAFWAPSYMMRVRGFSQETGMLYFGGITVVTGVAGTLLGGFLGDLLRRYTVKGYTLLSVCAMILGAINATIALTSSSDTVFLVALILAQLCLFLNTGPVNALIVGSVPPHMRASAMASSIFCIHLFGDAISPVLIGWISDRTSLSTGMLVTPGVFLFAAALWATTLPRRRRTTS